ncbi:MAG: nucleotidyl transferase AbiEii/AbiGii toxin family protein [Sphingobacteriales bacterium]|jgi:hypothetical protein
MNEVTFLTDVDFDEKYYRSGGIRLLYNSITARPDDMKEGILLEAGFDTVTPFQNITISSWAYDKAKNNPRVDLIDNRAINIACYHPGYTLVEKLQTIATKFRKEQESDIPNPNFMRQYYDIYCLLNSPLVQAFIGTEEYLEHKKVRFPDADFAMPINLNEAFLLSDPDTRSDFTQRYISSASLYYLGQPSFEDVLARIHSFLDKL